MPSEVRVERITEYGDMYIQVIPEEDGEPKTRFLVGSQILYTASKVFLRMFGPTSLFAEGNRLNQRPPRSSTNPLTDLPTIDLHDNPNVIGIVLKILHHVTDGIPRQLEFREFVDMAIVADKYELRRVLQLWADMWVKEYNKEDWAAPGNEDWLLIAWVFNYGDILHAASAQFIKRACYGPGGRLGSANGIKVHQIDDHVPPAVIGTSPTLHQVLSNPHRQNPPRTRHPRQQNPRHPPFRLRLLQLLSHPRLRRLQNLQAWLPQNGMPRPPTRRHRHDHAQIRPPFRLLLERLSRGDSPQALRTTTNRVPGETRRVFGEERE